MEKRAPVSERNSLRKKQKAMESFVRQVMAQIL